MVDGVSLYNKYGWFDPRFKDLRSWILFFISVWLVVLGEEDGKRSPESEVPGGWGAPLLSALAFSSFSGKAIFSHQIEPSKIDANTPQRKNP